MRVYRIYRKQRREAAFTGEGARATGARWNLPGTPMVYTSSTVSLCLLEFFVHFDPNAADMGQLGLECRWADIPETLPRLDIQESDLPHNWKEIPWPQSTQELGSKWIVEARHVVISVPSVVVPMERNFLLNPAHPAFSKINLGPPSEIEIDTRLFSR
jgi:RES domain-containing protein